jgi:hypothetical protein
MATGDTALPVVKVERFGDAYAVFLCVAGGDKVALGGGRSEAEAKSRAELFVERLAIAVRRSGHNSVNSPVK